MSCYCVRRKTDEETQQAVADLQAIMERDEIDKSSAVAEMGDRGHNRHGPKRVGGCCAPFAERWEPV